MELTRHNNMKTMRRKKLQIVVREHRTKHYPYMVEKKNSQVSTFDTYISHQDLVVSNYYHFRVSSE